MKPCWDGKGNGFCQGPGCSKQGPGDVEILRALGWHHGSGVTIGGDPYEALLCPHCAKDTQRRVVTRSTLEQDQLPIEWPAFRPKSQGGHTR